MRISVFSHFVLLLQVYACRWEFFGCYLARLADLFDKDAKTLVSCATCNKDLVQEKYLLSSNKAGFKKLKILLNLFKSEEQYSYLHFKCRFCPAVSHFQCVLSKKISKCTSCGNTISKSVIRRYMVQLLQLLIIKRPNKLKFSEIWELYSKAQTFNDIEFLNLLCDSDCVDELFGFFQRNESLEYFHKNYPEIVILDIFKEILPGNKSEGESAVSRTSVLYPQMYSLCKRIYEINVEIKTPGKEINTIDIYKTMKEISAEYPSISPNLIYHPLLRHDKGLFHAETLYNLYLTYDGFKKDNEDLLKSLESIESRVFRKIATDYFAASSVWTMGKDIIKTLIKNGDNKFLKKMVEKCISNSQIYEDEELKAKLNLLNSVLDASECIEEKMFLRILEFICEKSNDASFEPMRNTFLCSLKRHFASNYNRNVCKEFINFFLQNPNRFTMQLFVDNMDIEYFMEDKLLELLEESKKSNKEIVIASVFFKFIKAHLEKLHSGEALMIRKMKKTKKRLHDIQKRENILRVLKAMQTRIEATLKKLSEDSLYGKRF
ncbi:hypothetical protein ENBRE01_1173 [Enteropsectra breve]|nr:hypothetical protein ENBRE01_1173 [Enteropsectra breve]